jgi:subtilase family serine protease
VFDRAFGLPDPALRIIAPAGRIRRFRAHDSDMVGWAVETTLDVEWAHAMAPGARILLVETPVSETEGIVGFPSIVHAERYVIAHRLASVISQSFGATEQTFTSRRQLLAQRGAYLAAAARGVSVLAGSGDTGTAGYSDARLDFYPFRVNSWPSSDPLVTSVGGTRLYLDASGARRHPDEVWDTPFGTPAASGGGLSRVFARPAFQDGVAARVGRHRGTPDVSLNAAGGSAALIYAGFRSPGAPPGWYPAAGTSESVQLFGGIVAIAAGAAGHPLGPLNPKLYRLAAQRAPGVLDVTRGTNGVTVTVRGRHVRVPGYRARVGYDLSSGLGTVDAAHLVGELTGR